MNKEVPIKCPECGRVVHTATRFETDYYDPSFHCPRCKAKGVLTWERDSGKVKLRKGLSK